MHSNWTKAPPFKATETVREVLEADPINRCFLLPFQDSFYLLKMERLWVFIFVFSLSRIQSPSLIITAAAAANICWLLRMCFHHMTSLYPQHPGRWKLLSPFCTNEKAEASDHFIFKILMHLWSFLLRLPETTMGGFPMDCSFWLHTSGQ